ncbi:MAG: hypothetical protein NBV65_14425 [Burkholderiaceae bacterium]|nr:hypothetical protein [Burkholderiaceae bacterium]
MSSSASLRNAPLRTRIVLASTGLSGLLFAALIALPQVRLPWPSWGLPAVLALTWVMLAWLAMMWGTASLRRALRETRDGLAELARTGYWPERLGRTGVREVDACLQPARQAHDARERAIGVLRDAVRDLAEGRPDARVRSGIPGELAALAAELDDAGQQLDARVQMLKDGLPPIFGQSPASR